MRDQPPDNTRENSSPVGGAGRRHRARLDRRHLVLFRVRRVANGFVRWVPTAIAISSLTLSSFAPRVPGEARLRLMGGDQGRARSAPFRSAPVAPEPLPGRANS